MLQIIFNSLAQLAQGRAVSDLSWTPKALSFALTILSFHLLGLAVYRVYFSPLAKFPGPILASLTTWYMAYYDLLYDGYFFKKVQDLHRRYGPIVRITPNEVHISDPEFIKVLFTGNLKKRDKSKWLGRMLGLPGSVASTTSHELHRQRRAAMQRFFSRSSLRRLEPAIQRTLKNLLDRLQASGRQNDILSMNVLCKAATCDIITEYAFGQSTEYLHRDDLNVGFFRSLDANFQTAWYMAYLPWVGPLLQRVPPSMMGLVYPGLKSLRLMHEQWATRIEEIRREVDSHSDPDASVFHGILTSNLPAHEKSVARLRQEAQVLVQAGQDTTGK
ncbi:uncharacterized protein LDX57_009764 [Aspergillus melleus]|uniref:uncharacterized protein n=1 Tax=Aspergillus melleus TaxID=138277 RepID=UPI001E8DE13F|nr:uncharacterized protein LDX57_009764 [Aspergillus melleus]KAH8432118.1 hypothetical protein LDX57_009764 [Aspergillus melleus]